MDSSNVMAFRDPGLAAAIKAAGGATKLARALGIRREAIYQWDKIPPDRVIEIERLTGIDRGVLRPDLHPPRSAQEASP